MKHTHLIFVAVAAFAGLQPQAKAQTMVNLGSAAGFAVLGGSAITFTASPITITGDIGSSPTATVNNPGFVSFVSGSNLTGNGIMPTAKSNLTTAFNALTGQTVTTGITAFTGATLSAGVYAITSNATVDITGTLTLNGSSTDVFIFNMSSTLITASGSQLLLTGGAQASNVFWTVGSSATLAGGSSVFAGNVLALTSINLGVDSVVNGRLLAQNGAVTLGGSDTISIPSSGPEPATTALIAAFGALGLAFWRRRRAVS